MSAPEYPRRAAVEHVRAHCPALIATLVAMARELQDGQHIHPSEEAVDVAP